MRLLHKEISKEGGRVTIIPDDAEDMWCLYNLIAIGDSVRTETVRKVIQKSMSLTYEPASEPLHISVQ